MRPNVLRPKVAVVLATLVLLGVTVREAPVRADGSSIETSGLAVRLDAFVNQYASEGLFNGVVLAADRGQIVFAKGYGNANMEWRVPNAPDTKFRIASITKQFTAMLALQLVAEGKLRLDAPITEYLPDYPHETGAKITIHHLLTHQSGLPEYTWTGDLINAQVPDRPEEFIRRFSSDPLVFQPGTSFAYSNSGYYVLGVILEKVSGMPYEQLLHDRLLEPLGMADSGYDHVQDVLPKRATGYLRILAGRENPRYRYLDPARTVFYRAATNYEQPIYRDMITLYAAGAMYSTALDLYKWDRALASGKLLPPDLLETYFRPGRGNYACGWFATKAPVNDLGGFFDDFEGFRSKGRAGQQAPTTVQYHTGSVNGFITSIVRLPEQGQLIIVLNNTGMTRLSEINAGVVQILNNMSPPPLRHSVAEQVAGLMLEQGAEAGQHRFRELRAAKGDYYVNQNEIVTIGQALMRQAHAKEASALLEVGAEAFPTSVRIADNLGQAYAAAGNAEAARASTRKLLEMLDDPRVAPRDRDEYRRNATERLARLGDPDGPDHATGGDARRMASPRG